MHHICALSASIVTVVLSYIWSQLFEHTIQTNALQVVTMLLPVADKEKQASMLTFEQSNTTTARQLAVQNLSLDSTSDHDQHPKTDADDLLDLLDSVA